MPDEIEYLTHEDVQAELIAILIVFAEYCDGNNLRYTLSDGTLLGAVRHKGMIPWDDDIDVYLPRPDYERLISEAECFSRATGLKLANARNRSLPIPFTKVVNPSIRAQEDARIESVGEEHLWLDVFPIDGAPDDDAEFSRMVKSRQRSIALLNILTTRGSVTSRWKAAVKLVAGPLLRRVIDPFDLCGRVEASASACDFETASTVSPIAYGWQFAGKRMPKDGFLRRERMEFAGTEFWCMSCWDDYLTKQYGDYMTPPPIEKRTTHSCKAWRV